MVNYEYFEDEDKRVVNIPDVLNLDVELSEIKCMEKEVNEGIQMVQLDSEQIDITYIPDKSNFLSWLASDKIMTRVSFMLITLAMLSVASGGVAFKMFREGVPPLLGALWRAEGTLICLIPFFVIEVWRMPKEHLKVFQELSFWGGILYSGVSATLWTGTFVVALSYTSLTSVYLLNNCQPILIVIWNKLMGKQVGCLQIVGVMIGMTGLLLTVADPSSPNMIQTSTESIIGDIIALSGSIFAALYIYGSSSMRCKYRGTFALLVPMTIISVIMYTIGTVLIEKTHPAMLFGWFNSKDLPIVAWLAIVTGILGVSIIILVVKYLSPLTVSVILLFEPIAATIIAIIFNVEDKPHWVTWVGAVVLTAGIGLVSISAMRLNKQQQVH